MFNNNSKSVFLKKKTLIDWCSNINNLDNNSISPDDN